MVRCRLRPTCIVLNGLTSRKARCHSRPCAVARPALRLVGDGKILNTIDGAGPSKRRPRRPPKGRVGLSRRQPREIPRPDRRHRLCDRTRPVPFKDNHRRVDAK